MKQAFSYFTTSLSLFSAAVLALSPVALTSCGNNDEEVSNKPVGPTSDESSMPWNRPTGPEGGGPLGGLIGDR